MSIKHAKNFIALLAIVFSPIFCCAQEDPNAILEQIRTSQAQLDRPLSGQLRPEDSDPIPLELRLKGDEKEFRFQNPPETLVLQLRDESSILTDQAAGGKQIVSGAKMNQPVRGTDITYEDLSLRFLYWRNAKYEGEQRVKGITCSIILVQPAARTSSYGSVRIWVAKDRGAMLRAEAFDWKGKLVKRFEVVSGQRIEGKTVFKQIRIERVDPETGKTASRTYLEVNA
jgi:hypothetical protein